MANANVDFKSTHFEYPVLTKIHGPPTYETLVQLHNEIKANASSVPSSLGGGAHGHLGLVVPPAQYALLSNFPYVRPRQPPPFFIPPGADPQMAQMLRDNHIESLRIFREYLGVENTLKQQVVAAIDPAWLQAMRNPISNSITMPILEVIQYLFQVFGRITPDLLHEKEVAISTMVYDLLTPIDTVFTAVQELTDMAAMAGIPFSIPQTINMAYRVLNNTRKFASAITKWNRKPPVEKTWMNFKNFFRQAHEELRETTDLTAQETPFQANAIQEIIQGLKHELMGTTANNPFYANYMNDAASRNEELSQLHDEIASLKSTISSLQNSQRSIPTPPPTYIPTDGANYATTTRPNNASNEDASTLTEQPTIVPRRAKYCWTHGVCSHDSISCERKSQNHDDTATLANRKGGSTKGLKRYNRMKNK